MDDENEPRMSICLPNASLGELNGLYQWSAMKVRQNRFPVFYRWVAEVVISEIDRRKRGGEPGMIALPKWTNAELSQTLAGSYCLSHSPMTATLAPFVDDVAKHILSDAAERLLQSQAIEDFVHG